MEAEAKIAMSDWSSQTNWTVASGSLQDCITFESSLSSSADDDGTVDSSPKSPLILYPSSPDSGSCEIKINFTQKHEVLQVYVRSTARVYEIYSEPNLQSSNEYLCTVRCGIAARDDEVLCALNVEEMVSLHIKGINKEVAEENIKNEDDWVDVKVPDSPVLVETTSCINSAKGGQDLFEATAEITDANPCISITLRLLSLQNKGCVSVDEIYVFADPVAPDDSGIQDSRAENSSGSSLMAMFLPTLMQLSKTTGLGHRNENYPSLRKEEQHFPEVEAKPHPSDSVIKIQVEGKASITDQQEVRLQEVNEDSVGPSKTHIPPQDSRMESNQSDITLRAATVENNNSDTPTEADKMESNHSVTPSQDPTMESNRSGSLEGSVVRALEQLASRMDRIEGICLGFQEKMLLPISSIEARLQQVEQQLETLTMKLQNSGLPPDGSCVQSDADLCDDCDGYNVTRGVKSDQKGSHIEVPSVTPDDSSHSANTTQMLPGLIVTAPEFPDGEDEENNVSGIEMDSSNDQQRQKISIDVAVTSALAGFLSSASIETPRYTKSLTVRAPDFINEDDNESIDASPRTNESENIDCIQESNSQNIDMESGEEVNRDPSDKQSDETLKESEDYGQLCSGKDNQDKVGVIVGTLAEDNPRTDFDNIVEDNKTRNISDQISDGLSSISDLPGLHQTDSGSSSTTQEGDCARSDLTDAVATEVPRKTSHEEIIENALGFSRCSSTAVDFETSILDVKFTSEENSVSKRFLEALLVDDTQVTSYQDHHPVEESSDDILKSHDDVSEQYNLVSLDVEEPFNINTNNNGHFSVDKDYCSLINVPVEVEGDNWEEDHKQSYDEAISSSLI
ncbi:uncharacterized protein G2W53_014080 [Senna tora]|uniref:Uncharacterized protein n=1 Tax=Senna tora TaxID=362788 RepID=A0A834U1J9_9FABA|nr:uncharacterized protein G2W53_014080 [Senna tora]